MTEYEYTIAIGWDSHTLAGYSPYVTGTPEEAVERRGTEFHPHFDCVVRRPVEGGPWEFTPEIQTFDSQQKMDEYHVAMQAKVRLRKMYTPKKSSALPNNRRVRTRVNGEEPWFLKLGEYDLERMADNG